MGPMSPDEIGSTVKIRVVNPLQKALLNPLVKLAFGLGIPPAGDALLETIGRRTGQPRSTPVCDGLDGYTFWIIAQHGRRAEYVRNIEANARVRVKVSGPSGGRWRRGTAHILDDDDPRERRRILSRTSLTHGLCFYASGAVSTSLVTIRIDLDRPKRGSPAKTRRNT
jgi:deazaflavin-dependent oxidoreductase (nitroreductase family)